MYNRIIVLAFLLALTCVAVVTANEEPVSVDPPSPAQYEALERNWRQLDDSDVEECAGATDNLLHNPSFEGAYDSYTPPVLIPDCPWGICMSAQMAPEWTPYWRSHDENDESHIYRMPEWKAASTAFTNPVRVRSGERAQQWFTFYGTHQAGIYQQVEGITPGNSYCLSIWGHAWSSNGGSYTDPNSHGFLNQQIGIDPTGGTDYTSSNVIWTAPRTQYDYYGLFKLVVPAEADKLTVFFHSEPLWAWKHNDVYFDDAILVSVEAPAPTALAVSHSSFSFSAETEFPTQITTDLITIDFTPAYSGLEWTASIIPDGNFAPTLSTISGKTGESTAITLNSAGLAAGNYTARVMFQSNANNTVNDPNYVDINLTVTHSPARFAMGSTNMGGITEHGVPQTLIAQLPVPIKNWENATWTATDLHSPSWMTLLTPSGNNGEPLKVSLNSSNLPIGTYTATVLLTGHNAVYNDSTQEITVTLIVVEKVKKSYLPLISR
ncbi:MAG: hypothetical protein ACPG8W_21180 [Candidatus Promineifilaceae bacterium]